MTRPDITPVFVSRQTAAALLEISVDTFDLWLRAGFIPAPHIDRGQIIRWHWPTLEGRLSEGGPTSQHDPSVMGLKNVQKGRRRAAA